jgi:hypothetical protein
MFKKKTQMNIVFLRGKKLPINTVAHIGYIGPANAVCPLGHTATSSSSSKDERLSRDVSKLTVRSSSNSIGRDGASGRVSRCPKGYSAPAHITSCPKGYSKNSFSRCPKGYSGPAHLRQCPLGYKKN